MGYRSTVKIKISKKGFEMVKENIEKSEYKEMLDFDCFEELEDGILFGYTGVKWYRGYSDVNTIESVLRKLDKEVKENPDTLTDYFYKEIEIGEDGLISEATNDDDEEFTSDFYAYSEFSL